MMLELNIRQVWEERRLKKERTGLQQWTCSLPLKRSGMLADQRQHTRQVTRRLADASDLFGDRSVRAKRFKVTARCFPTSRTSQHNTRSQGRRICRLTYERTTLYTGHLKAICIVQVLCQKQRTLDRVVKLVVGDTDQTLTGKPALVGWGGANFGTGSPISRR